MIQTILILTILFGFSLVTYILCAIEARDYQNKQDEKN